MSSFSAQELATRIGGIVQGDGHVTLDDVAPLESAGARHLTFAESRKQIPQLKRSEAGAVLVTAETAEALKDSSTSFIVVKHPQQAFIQAMLLFRPQRERRHTGIHQDAIVDSSARLGPDCNVSAFAIIGSGVVIGSRCDIGPGVIIGDGCVIGDECILHSHAVLYPDVILGHRIIVHAQAVIGADGFGYFPDHGALRKIPHTGTVIIEDDVEIGAGATIDRGMIEATVIGTGTKLDNQVMIAHNCRIGRHNAFASQVGLAGSVTTGDYVQMGGQVGVADHCRIASQVKLGGKSGVMGDLPEAGIYHHIPAVAEKEAIKNYLGIRKIPELRDQLKQLTEQVAQLQAQLNELSSPSIRNPAA
jgi:UDP-3-O-[3-hydroxymyristoyl] glucosamine N-acyltransferase